MRYARSTADWTPPGEAPTTPILVDDWRARIDGKPALLTEADLSHTINMVKDGLANVTPSDVIYISGHPNLPVRSALWMISDLLRGIDLADKHRLLSQSTSSDLQAWKALRALASSTHLDAIVASSLVYADFTGGTYGDLVANPSVNDAIVTVIIDSIADLDLDMESEIIGRLMHRPNLSDEHLTMLVNQMTAPTPFGIPRSEWYSDAWHPLVLSYQQALGIMLSDDWMHAHRITATQRSRLIVAAASC